MPADEQNPVAGLPDALAGPAYGYMTSRAFLTALELDAFNSVGPDGATPAEAARRMDTDQRATAMLLRTLVGMGLMEVEGGRYVPSAVAARHLTDEAEEDLRPALMHCLYLWEPWSGLTECIRSGEPAPTSGIEAPKRALAYMRALQKSAEALAPRVVEALGLEEVGSILDLGAGPGTYSVAFARAAPGARVLAFDRRPVTLLTRANITRAGLAGRISVRSGDLLEDDLGQPGRRFDLVWVSMLCHILSPEQNADLLRKLRGRVAAGGRIAIHDFIMGDAGAPALTGALFGLNMLVNTKAGNAYTLAEYRRWLSGAGFGEPEVMELPDPTALAVAKVE